MRWLIIMLSIPGFGASVPTLKVTGPIPATAKPGDPSHNYPFFSATDLLGPYDYVEEEFYVEGLAPAYATARNDTATLAPGGPFAYKTRVIVRRPKSATKFNGTVILEWSNVTAMHDFEIDWGWSHDHMMRRGFAYGAVSAQTNGVASPTGLKKWNPGRYGSLDVTAGGKFANDELSYSIFSAVAQALKEPAGTSLVGSLRVKYVIATGQSQSARRLVAYYNSVHPTDRVVDGFVLHDAVQSDVVRADVNTPAWKLLSETGVIRGQAAVRQPDTRYLRTWEVAGTSHGDWDLIQFLDRLRARDLPQPESQPCERPALSRVPSHLVQDAVYDWMKLWVEKGTEPPHAPPIAMTSIGAASDRLSVAARDENGNALGGIRLAQFAVPTATDTGLNEGPAYCRIYGSHEPFSSEKLARLYPNPAGFTAEVERITEQNLKAGFITEEGAAQTKWEAVQRNVH